jgi:enolase
MPNIQQITCNKIVNSRADWTIETRVTLDDGSVGVQAVPDGASKGENEALFINVEKAIAIVEGPLKDLLVGENPFDQERIDTLMIEMDGTPNKSHLGGNSILSISLAVAQACAVSKGLPLYKYFADFYGTKIDQKKLKFPTPVFNVLNGGKHARNNLSFQEFMVIPAPDIPFDKAMEMGVDIYHTLRANLQKDGYDVDVGDEGGFAPNNFNSEKALKYVKAAAGEKYKVGEEVFFGMDVAAESFYDRKKYTIAEQKLKLTSDELCEYYAQLLKKFEIIYLEDPFYEKDYAAWQGFYTKFSDKLMVVADDLAVTNTKFLQRAIDDGLANAVIVKPNQVGTLTETIKFIRLARLAGMSLIISHRSGDTGGDTFIADLALAVEAEFIKSGAPARGERVAKYNRLLEVFSSVKN